MKDGGFQDQLAEKTGSGAPTQERATHLTWFGRLRRSRTGMIVLLVAYVGFVFFVSSRTRAGPPVEFPHADKLAHAVEYWILGWLLARVLDPRRSVETSRLYLGVLLGALLIGAVDELIQSRVPGRESSILDLGADVLGAFLAAFLWLRVRTKMA